MRHLTLIGRPDELIVFLVLPSSTSPTGAKHSVLFNLLCDKANRKLSTETGNEM